MTLGQLDIKLRLAHDPAIHNGKELELKYFDFLVSSRERSDRNGGSFRIKEFSSIAGGDASQLFASHRLKQLYRTISRNCHEAFMSGDKEESTDLKKLFIEASNIYNESMLAERDYFIHYYSLINLLGKAIMCRWNHGLELKFNDYTGMTGGQPLPRISREFIIKTRREVDEVLLRVKSSEDLSFKIKNVCDEELAFMHQNHLERQIEFLDGCIQEVLREIEACIEAKVSQNEKNQRNIKN